MKQKHILMAVIMGCVVSGCLFYLCQAQDVDVLTPDMEISDVIDTNADTPQDVPEDFNQEPVSPVSPEDVDTESDLLTDVTSGVSADEEPPEEVATTPTTEPVPEPTAEELAQQSMDESMDLLYAAQDRYMANIERLAQEIELEYTALPVEEQTRDNKILLCEARLDEVSAMEKECDLEVEDILITITKAQLILGNTDIVNEIRSYYSNMKTTVKSDYLTELRYS